jgi:hypothetical protein
MDELSFQDVIDNLSEALGQADGEKVAEIYNQVCSDQIVYKGDSVWERQPCSQE